MLYMFSQVLVLTSQHDTLAPKIIYEWVNSVGKITQMLKESKHCLKIMAQSILFKKLKVGFCQTRHFAFYLSFSELILVYVEIK